MPSGRRSGSFARRGNALAAINSSPSQGERCPQQCGPTSELLKAFRLCSSMVYVDVCCKEKDTRSDTLSTTTHGTQLKHAWRSHASAHKWSKKGAQHAERLNGALQCLRRVVSVGRLSQLQRAIGLEALHEPASAEDEVPDLRRREVSRIARWIE